MSATAIPGMNACHAVITEECRTGRGDDGAFDEAARRCREAYQSSLDGWRGLGKEPVLHLVLTVERPT